MKATAAFLVVTAICQLGQAHFSIKSNFIAPRSIGEKFKEALENLKELLRQGNATAGIPVIDPLNLTHQEFNVQNELIKMKGHVANLLVTGLSDYVVQNADFKFVGKKIIVDFLWPGVSGSTDYDVTDGALLGKFPVYGSGNLKLKMNEFRFATEANIKMDTKADRLSVLGFNNTSIALENLAVRITGLFYDEELSTLISAVISENAANMLRDFHGDVTVLINKKMFKVSNDYLKDMSLKELLKKLR